MKGKGYITVYFSLILIVVLAVLFTTIESARMSGIRMRYQVATLLGLESIFADYYIPLFKEYGVFFLNSTYQTDNINEYENKLQEYIEYNIYPNKDLLLTGNNLYTSYLDSVAVMEKTLATEYSGDILEGEILSYMEYAMPVDSAMWILGKIGLIDESKVVKNFFDDLSGIHGKASKVDKSVHSISKKVSEIRNYKDGFSESSNMLKEKLFYLEELYNMEINIQDEEEIIRHLNHIDSVEGSAEKQLRDILGKQKALKNLTKKTIEQEESYIEWTDRLMEDLLIIEADVEKNFNELSDEMSKSISEEIESLKIFSGGQSDYYKVEKVGNLLRKNQGILVENIANLSVYQGHIEEGDIGGLLSALESCESAMNYYHRESLLLNYADEEINNEYGNVLEEIEKLMKDGIYSLVISESMEISEKMIEVNRLPSREYFTDSSKEKDILKETSDNLLLNEYIVKKFGNIVEVKEGKVLDYEVEYILEGKVSDDENLKSTINKLLLIREAMNLIHLFSDSGKKKEAEMLAISLVGFTGMYGLIKVTQLLVLAAWAFVESIVDIKNLLDGNSVELLKKATEWETSLSGLISFVKSKSSRELTGASRKKGLDYSDYLRLLLYSKKKEEKLYHVMDLIQKNIQKNYDAEFYMENCIHSLNIKVNYEINQLFLSLPFMNGYVGKDQKYKFFVSNSYSYEFE